MSLYPALLTLSIIQRSTPPRFEVEVYEPPFDVCAPNSAGSGPFHRRFPDPRGAGEDSVQRQSDAATGKRRLPVCPCRSGQVRRTRTSTDAYKVDKTGKSKHTLSHGRRHDFAVSGVDHLQGRADDRSLEHDRSRLRDVWQSRVRLWAGRAGPARVGVEVWLDRSERDRQANGPTIRRRKAICRTRVWWCENRTLRHRPAGNKDHFASG